MNKDLPILIIGQGIAGTTLAFHLYFQGLPFHIIDDGYQQCASKVAAGLANPFTGPKMLLSWNAKALFPYALSFYEQVGEILGEQVFIKKPIVRPFLSIAEQNEILSKANEHQSFLFSEEAKSEQAFSLKDIQQYIQYDYDGLITAQSGFLKTERYLCLSKQFFLNSFIEQRFSYSEIGVNAAGFFEYAGKRYKSMVFANGLRMQATGMPFEWLPFRANFGEVMEITWPRGPQHFIANRKVYAVSPNEDSVYRVGATYKNTYHPSLSSTTEGEQELISQFSALSKTPFEVRKFLTGLRPATKDRKPFVGEHPELKEVYCLGGFGAKGVSLAPWCSAQLLQYMQKKQLSLMPEIDIARFKKEYLAHKTSTEHTFS